MFNFLPQEDTKLFITIVLLMLWTIPWKGYALWKAARKKDKWWFIMILVVNSAALLEAAYIFHFSERKEKKIKKAV